MSGASLVVPYYHVVSDESIPHVRHLYLYRSVAEFEKDLEYLLAHFTPITLQDIVDVLNGIRRLSRPCFHLTFDDGFREVHDVVSPILQRAGVPATFFLNTAFLNGRGIQHANALSLLVDRLDSKPPTESILRHVAGLLPSAAGSSVELRARVLSIPWSEGAVVPSLAEALDVDLPGYVADYQPYLSSDQIRGLIQKGFSIGAHSHDHPRYADISLQEQLAQTCSSLQLLDSAFNLTPKAFAFPHTDYGVEAAFFSAMFRDQLLDVSFGTAGLVRHFWPRNIERVRMEGSSAPASEILGWEYARAAYSRFRPH